MREGFKQDVDMIRRFFKIRLTLAGYELIRATVDKDESVGRLWQELLRNDGGLNHSEGSRVGRLGPI